MSDPSQRFAPHQGPIEELVLFTLANLLLLVGVPLILVPFWEDAARLPKVLLLLWAAALLVGPALLSLKQRKGAMPLILACFYLWRAGAPWSTLEPLDLRLSMLALGVVGIAWHASPPRSVVLRALLGLAALESALALFQFLGLMRFGYGSLVTPRAMGTLGNSNSLCLWLLPLALVAWEHKRPRLALWLLLGASLSGARAGLLAGVVGAGYLVAQLSGQQRRGLLLALVIPVILAVVFQVRGPQRVPEGIQVRLALWTAAGALIEQHPLGLGPGQFGRAYLPYRGLEPAAALLQSRIPEQCHNELLGLGVEAGWPALLLGIALLVLGWLQLHSPRLKAALLVLTVQALFFRASAPIEILWLYLITGAAEKEEPAPPSGATITLPGLILLLGLLPATFGWGWAEYQAWLAREAELGGRWSESAQYWHQARRSGAPSRQTVLRRRFLASQLRLNPARGEIQGEALSELIEQDREPDPYVWVIRARFLKSVNPVGARRALLEAYLRDPWNRSLEQAVGAGPG